MSLILIAEPAKNITKLGVYLGNRGLSILPLLAIIGCATPVTLNVPKVALSQENSDFQLNENSETFALVKLVNGIDRGETVFAFPVKRHSNFNICNYNYRGSGGVLVTYSGGKRYLGNWSTELGRVFHETLSNRGYVVAGNPADLFNSEEKVSSAKFQIAGRLIDMKGQFCDEHGHWAGAALGITSGEIYVEFEWSVMDTLQREVVLKTQTKAYYNQENSIADGVSIIFENAFAEAVDKFATSDELIALAKGEIQEPKSSSPPLSQGILILNGTESEEFKFTSYEPNLISVGVGGGHGSGFFIGDEGYVITNAHVVGSAKQVRIKMSNSLELIANVVASIPNRDVALLKVPIRTKTPLYIDRQIPAVATEVYAAGSPMSEDLQSTITKGIVSGHRTDKSSGEKFIQSDVAISPGSSGGPLFNKKGAVIGISVSKLTGRSSEGLGFFIPIGSALDALGVILK